MTWQDAITQTCADYVHAEFQWGAHDCCTFANDYVERLTGINHRIEYEYDDADSADNVIGEHGIGGLLRELLGEPHGGDPIAGDVVLCDIEGNDLVGVFNGAWTWAFVHDKGLSRIPQRFIAQAWGVK